VPCKQLKKGESCNRDLIEPPPELSTTPGKKKGGMACWDGTSWEKGGGAGGRALNKGAGGSDYHWLSKGKKKI